MCAGYLVNQVKLLIIYYPWLKYNILITSHFCVLAPDLRWGEGDFIPSRASFLLIVQRMDVYSSATIYLLKLLKQNLSNKDVWNCG